ncbi:MAG: APC family permease [Oscillospiraceae bacterium]|nr:APC family permease [Oscillospiraceae bacterium]
MTEKNNQKNTISVFQMAMMTTIAVASLRGLPAMAIMGWSSIIMYIVPAVLFLVPTALIGAELGTTYKGGVYVWVREAFGNRFGFVAVWLQWIQNVVWFPIQLAFVAAAIAFTVGQGDLSNSGLYIGIVVIAVYWLATLLALLGGNLFAKVGSIGGLVGTLIPAGILIALGAIWLGTSQPIASSFIQSTFIPPIAGVASLVLLISNVLSYAGMEMNAVHAGDMKDPGRGFTKAMLIAFALILGIFILPTLAIAIAVPAKQLGMANGIMVAFQTFFNTWNISWMTNVIAGAIAFGALASIVTWVMGPSRGVMNAARTGLLPLLLQKQNKRGVQIGILIPQALIVTLLALIYVLVPNVSDVFMALIGMAAALYVVMYIMMFAAAMVLRRKEPDVKRGYKVPVLGFIASVGLIACVLAFIMSFFPASGESAFPQTVYPLVVAGVVLVLGIPPFILYACRKPKWDVRSAEEKEKSSKHD